MSNPFRLRSRRKKPRQDTEFKDGRVRLADKSELREAVYVRAHGQCEYEKVRGLPHHDKCPRSVGYSIGQLAHKKHGMGKRDDSLGGCFWASRECHQLNDHGTHGVRRRPGKIMKIKDAQAYWNGTECFCENRKKKERESFCPDCVLKLSPQTRHDLENADDPEIYRETLARAELEILIYGQN